MQETETDCVLSDLLDPTDNKYDYLPTTVNMCSEVVKLVLCVVLALWNRKKGKCRCFKEQKCVDFLRFAVLQTLFFYQ